MLIIVCQTFANDYIKLFPPKDRTEVANSVVKVDLTRNLGTSHYLSHVLLCGLVSLSTQISARLNPRLSAEVDQTVNEVIPACKDWTPVQIFPAFLRIVAIVSGNLFVGADLCRNEAYLATAIDFTNDITAGAAEIKRWPKWLRSFAMYFNLAPAVARGHAHRRRMQEFFEPLVATRRQLMKEGKEVPDDVLQWMLEKTMSNGILDVGHLTDMQLLLTLASIHTTSLSATAM